MYDLDADQMTAAIRPLLNPGEELRNVAFGAKGIRWAPWADALWNDNIVALTDQRLLIVPPGIARELARTQREEDQRSLSRRLDSFPLSTIHGRSYNFLGRTTLRIYVEGRRLPIRVVQFKGDNRGDGDQISARLEYRA